MMKYILSFIILLTATRGWALEFSVGAQSYAAMPLVVGVVGGDSQQLKPLSDQLVKDLALSGQFAPKLISLTDMALKKSVLKKMAEDGAALAIFVNKLHSGGRREFEWRLYDLLDLKMLIGKKVSCQGELVQVAHVIANQIWQKLMGNVGAFNSMIVACKKQKLGSKNCQYIYAFHPTHGAANAVPLIMSNTINFAPRWHPKRRLLYYSQHTVKNVRLMVVNSDGKSSIVTDFEGLNLMPAISLSILMAFSINAEPHKLLTRCERSTSLAATR